MGIEALYKQNFPVLELDDFLPQSMCQELIMLAQNGPWHQSNFGSRKIYSLGASHLAQIEAMLSPHIPTTILNWHYVGIHPGTFQIFRYDESDSFPRHTDKEYVVDALTSSLFTLVVYLNSSRGGCTIFPEMELTVVPKTGKAVIFPQNLLHQSEKILTGQKFILRGQILYRNEVDTSDMFASNLIQFQ